MYSLRLFGGLALEGPSGPLTGRAAQRRRLALLAMLGTAGEKGVSRDKLAGYLWPESDETAARHLLSDSLYVLHRALGEDAILAMGEFLRLNPEVVWCDVVAFEAAIRRQKLEEAVDLYAGPFLDGFYLGAVGELDQWVETERRRLADAYAKALESLAERAESASQHTVAAGWWKQLAAHDPYNSRVVLRLMQALAAAGDPANALEYARVHELRVRDELGIEPPEDLRAYAERLRKEPVQVSKAPEPAARVESRVTPAEMVARPTEGATGIRRVADEIHRRSLWQVLLVYCGGALIAYQAVQVLTGGLGLPQWFPGLAVVLFIVLLPVVIATAAMVEEGGPPVAREDATPVLGEGSVAGETELVASRWEGGGSRGLLTWRNAGSAFVGALAVWGAVAAGWLLVGGRIERPVEAAAIDPANRIVVLPFSYRGSEEHAYLGEGMVDLLSYSLDGVREVRMVTPRAVFSVLRQYDPHASDPHLGATVARHLDAARFVEGEIVESSGQLRISARLVRVDADPADVTAVVVDGEVEDGIADLVDALSTRLLVGSEAGQLSQLGRVASMTTDSLAALKAFLEGVRSLRALELQEAGETLRRAVEIDSTFALAWWQLALFYTWGLSPELCLEAAGLAVRWSERLPWRERQLVLGREAWARGDFHAAERHYRAVTRRYPENVSAWYGLSDTYLYPDADVHGHSRAEAFEVTRQAYIRSAEYEPDWSEPAFLYWWQAVWAGDRALADSLLPKWTSREEQPLYTRIFEAFCIGDQVAQDSIVARAISSGTVGGMFATMHASACETGVWRGADIARELARRAESDRVRAWAYLSAATYELALGRRQAARAEFDAVRADEPTWASQHEAYWLLPAAFGAQRSELEAARDSLLARDVPIVSPLPAPEQWFSYWTTTLNDSIQPHIRLYLLGRLSARLGDYDAALRYADEVQGLKSPLLHASVSRDKAQAIRAFVLREQGRYQEALTALEAAPRTVGHWIAPLTPFTREPQERYLRAELLAELGRYGEALRWLSTVGNWSSETPMRAPAHLLTAQIYERLDDTENAAVHYGRFIELWSDCDPELQPWVEAARRALEALSPDT